MTEATSRPISRRTVAKGAAWTAPVILGGVAAPAYASSGRSPVLSIGGACKAPGGSCAPFEKGYIVTVSITNPSSKDVWLYVDPGITVKLDPGSGGGSNFSLTYKGYYEAGVLKTGHIKIPAGEGVTLELSTEESNSANRAFTLTMIFNWGHTAIKGGDPDAHAPVSAGIKVSSTPPDCTICN